MNCSEFAVGRYTACMQQWTERLDLQMLTQYTCVILQNVEHLMELSMCPAAGCKKRSSQTDNDDDKMTEFLKNVPYFTHNVS